MPSGLGPLGRRAVQAAANELTTAEFSDPADQLGNPAVITQGAPDEDATMPPPEEWYDFDSSRIAAAAYDRDSQRLYVHFVKPTSAGGTPWLYEGVPSNVWRNLRRSQSPGKFVNRVLNDYNYHRGRNWEAPV
jgi:hypothetical protein